MAERRRREARSAEGAEEGGVWGGGIPRPNEEGVWGKFFDFESENGDF